MSSTASSDVVVVGAGGHAKVCIELLRAQGARVAVCVGTDPAQLFCLDVPVVCGDHHLQGLRAQGYRRAFIALGGNRLRQRLADFAISLGYDLVNAISPTACIAPSARLGCGVAVMAGAVINAQADVGDLCIINTLASVDHDCLLGRAVHIAPRCALAGNVQVGDGAFLGIGTVVIPEMTIGAHAVIGAGGVVVKPIPPHCTAVGVPARPAPLAKD